MLPYKKGLKKFAQQLRENMTDSENHLWWKIKTKQVNGLIFYRQKPIGDYIVDFYCPKAKLVIEIDGSHHFIGETIEYDRIRDDYLSSLGLKVLRFTNNDVLKNVKGVLEKIGAEISGEIPLIPPFPKGETSTKIPLVPPFSKGETSTIIPLIPPFSKGET
jgi:very-short-patch-repair endonuclease